VAEIHDRMPLILAPGDYLRWLSDEPDPSNLPQAEPTRMWPISTRFNKLENDDPSVAAPIEPCAAGSFRTHLSRRRYADRLAARCNAGLRRAARYGSLIVFASPTVVPTRISVNGFYKWAGNRWICTEYFVAELQNAFNKIN